MPPHVDCDGYIHACIRTYTHASVACIRVPVCGARDMRMHRPNACVQKDQDTNGRQVAEKACLVREKHTCILTCQHACVPARITQTCSIHTFTHTHTHTHTQDYGEGIICLEGAQTYSSRELPICVHGFMSICACVEHV